MALAYSYLRMSRPEQMRGDSLRRQVAAAEAWAAARGIRIDETISDIGVSAYRGKNRTVGALGGFLRMVEDGRIAPGSFLIVESLDRLSREAVLETVPRFIDLINAGVVIVTLMDKQEYSKERLTADWTPLIVSIAVMARAHEESQTKATRVREAWDKKRAAAASKPLTARVPAWLELRDGRIEAIPGRAEIVRRIFRETSAGEGRRSIVRRLNDEKIPSFQGKEKGWRTSYIAKLLSNRAVTGEFQAYLRDGAGRKAPEGEPVPGYFPEIVSQLDFLRAGQARASRTAAPGRRGAHVTNLFIGLAKCVCGASMQMENKGRPPKGQRYLACSDARRGVGCDNERRWRVEKVEEAVLQALRRVELPGAPRMSSAAKDAIEVLEGKLATALKRRDNLLDLVEEGDEAAKARFRAVTKTVGELKAQVEAARQDLDVAAAMPSYAEQLSLLRDIRDRLASATGDELTALRTRLAQTLRTTMIRIDFGPRTIVGRMRVEHVRYRVGISQGGAFPDGAPVTILDETPRILTEQEKDDYAAEALEDRARADDEMATFDRLRAKSTR